MTKNRDNSEIKQSNYTEDYFFTCVDGFAEFKNNYGSSYIKKKEISLLDVQPGLKFLDIGHGRGEILYHCEKLGAFAYGVDYSDAANSIAKNTLKQSPNAWIIKSNCEPLPFKDGTFDRILVGDLIEHLSFEKGVRLLKEISRVLAPGGYFLLHTSPNSLFMKFIYPILILFMDKKRRKGVIQHVNIQNKVHIHEYNYFNLKRLAKTANFKAHIWIDADITRKGTFRHINNLTEAEKIIIRLVTSVTKYRFMPILIFLGNDLWMKSQKVSQCNR